MFKSFWSAAPISLSASALLTSMLQLAEACNCNQTETPTPADSHGLSNDTMAGIGALSLGAVMVGFVLCLKFCCYQEKSCCNSKRSEYEDVYDDTRDQQLSRQKYGV